MNTFIDDLRNIYIPRYGVLMNLILINVIVYLMVSTGFIIAWFASAEQYYVEFFYDYLSLPANLNKLAVRPWTILTYMFMHKIQDLFHIIFNMLWLFWIGRIYREYTTKQQFLETYFFGGFVGGMFFILIYNLVSRLSNAAFLIGASGAVNAIIVAAATRTPNYPINLLFFGTIQLKWLALVFVIIDLISIPGLNTGGMLAHLGGALAGFAYVHYRFNRTPKRTPMTFSRGYQSVTHGKRSVAQYSNTSSGKPSAQEIDRILDKLSSVGYDRLTPEEKQRLLDASKD